MTIMSGDPTGELASPVASSALEATKTPKTESSSAECTPPRNNYSGNMDTTPIASIKRPRNSTGGRKQSSQRKQANATPTPTNSAAAAATPLSPLHGVRPVPPRCKEDELAEADGSWVGPKVDALFSPVCRFLQHHEEQLHEEKIDDAMSVGSQNSPSSEGPKPLDSTDSDTQPTAVSTSSETTDVADEDDEEEIAAADDDDDISMEPPPQPDDTSDEFNPWQFIKALPPYDLVRRRGKMATAALPPKRDGDPEKTIVLDLDETLVHCTVEGDGSAPPPDMTFPVTFHGITYTVHVQLRPHLHAFLQALKGRYEVVVFTASQKVYADELLNRLDPGGQFIHHRLFRESCLEVEGNFLKDLNVLGRDLSKTVLVDNSPHAFGYQVDNGIPIESWFDDPTDKELLKLERFLRLQVLQAKDVREVVRNKFQSHALVAAATPYYCNATTM